MNEIDELREAIEAVEAVAGSGHAAGLGLAVLNALKRVEAMLMVFAVAGVVQSGRDDAGASNG